MAPGVVRLRHDVEEEGFDVVVQGLVVQKEFSQQTQVLTVNLVGGGMGGKLQLTSTGLPR